MKKAYLLLYSDNAGNRESIKKWANNEPMVITWRYDLPNCFYLITEHTSQELYNSFSNYRGEGGRYIFIEVGEDRQGKMLPDTWYLLRHKKPKG